MSDDGLSKTALAVDLLKAYRWHVATVTVAVAVSLIIIQPTVPTVTVPRWIKVVFFGLLAAALLGYLPGALLLDWLYDPPRRYIVCLGFSDGPAGVWELTPSAWSDVQVTEGQLHQWEGTEWPTYECESFHPESLTAVGTWRGSKSDSELMRKEKELDELRTDLEADANTSIDMELQIASRVRQAVKEIGRAVIDEHASATTYEGDRIADVLGDIRRDVEQDAGDPEPQRNGEKPTTDRDLDPTEALGEMMDLANGSEAPRDD